MGKRFSLLFLMIVTFADANTLLALLKKIENNHTLHMVYKQKPFVCTPYGVETISQLVLRTDVNTTCMQYLGDFRRAYPDESSFAQIILHVQQLYSVEGKKDRCLLKLRSDHSYSESLIENGYGRIPLAFDFEDSTLEYRFKRAQERAKKTESGIWADMNIRNCFLSEDKK